MTISTKQYLIEQFGSLGDLQSRSANDLSKADRATVCDLDVALTGALRSFDAALAESFTTLPDGQRVFMPDYETLIALGKANGIEEEQILWRTTFSNEGFVTGVHLRNDLPIREISMVADFVDLRKLVVQGTNVADFSCLASLKNLECLDVCASDFNDTRILQNMTKLKFLYLSNSRIHSLEGIQNNPKLEVLGFENTRVSDLSPLAALGSLTKVQASGSDIHDVRPLAGLDNLLVLSIGGCPIVDPSPLAGNSTIRNLELTVRSPSDEAFVKSLPKLTYAVLEFEAFEFGSNGDYIARGD